jgi:hypothetical protein
MDRTETTCDGCGPNRDGRCHDRTIYGLEGGDLLTDDGPRLCYEPCRYLSESLTSFLVDLVHKQEKRGQ